jgi:flagellar hook-associated protein 2
MSIGKISSAGIGSGLDVNGIVTQLMALERRPIELLQGNKTKLNTQLSALGRIQSSLSALASAASKLNAPSNWSQTTVGSSDATVVTATAGSTSIPGRYAVEVSSLAKGQTLTSTTFTNPSTVVGTGTLSIQLGTWTGSPGTFTPGAAAAVDVPIAAGQDTLTGIRNQINAANAGVTASIVTDASGSRLAIRSNSTGAEQGFKIEVTDDDTNNIDAAGLSGLAYDPQNSVNNMTRAQAASNAAATINGIAVSSATNELADIIDGLTINLSRTTTAPVELTVARDNAAIKKTITDFATAYNDVVKVARELTAYDETSKKAGALQGDRATVGLLNTLRSLVGGESGATTAFTRLADVGLEPQRDGTLKVTDSKLDNALGKLTDLKAFFSRSETGTAQDGFSTLLREFADNTTGSEGTLTSRQTGLRAQIDQLDDRAEAMENRLALVEQRLRAQYTRLDESMGAMSGLQSYIGAQVSRWNSGG